MANKTHKTAVVIIPPEKVWPQIQAIREKHDRQVRRWMPHVTLLYPFRPKEQFDGLAEQIAPVLEDIEPFEIELREFKFFRHRQESYTLWLSPEPRKALERMQTALLKVVPDCDDVVRISGKFLPHLSFGQVKGQQAMMELLGSLQATWQPISFKVERVSLIWRGDPPDDVFRVGKTLPLKGIF